MGNCQAAEAATVVIVHPAGKVDRVYWSVSANQIMSSNPGHYVAHLVCSPSAKTEDGKPVRHLKLLRPDDTLHIGQVYRLISFEDVLKEFAAKKCVKLGKLLKETRGIVAAGKRKDKGDSSKAWSSSQITASDQERNTDRCNPLVHQTCKSNH
ncbi:hypothetical protein IFM89_016656 [Coptis chinensis]|uniref:DUF4228 domain protein n=1 Tax=Coptis chinensis TaxID=261450 RepID=A0A835IR50_9MAGN|nr:hypothetical protein IFM89_016656 [Coptis chinensis]